MSGHPFYRRSFSRVFPSLPFSPFPSPFHHAETALSMLPSCLHSLGYYSDGRSTIFLPKLLREVDAFSLFLSLSLVSLDGESRGWAANSFKSRCGPGNSANPLRIHRAPLANSSLLLTSSFPRSLLPPSRCGFPPPSLLPRPLEPPLPPPPSPP